MKPTLYEIEHRVKLDVLRATPLWFWEVGAKKWRQRGIGEEEEAEVEMDDDDDGASDGAD